MGEERLKPIIAEIHAIFAKIKHIEVIPRAIVSVTAEELIKCLERPGITDIYSVPPSDVIAPGESTTFQIAPPVDKYCVVASGRPASSLHYYTSLLAEFTDWEGFVKARANFTRWFPSWEFFPIEFIWCQPRTMYRFTWSNDPTSGSDAFVGVWQLCNVISAEDYNILAKAVLGRVLEALGIQAGLMRITFYKPELTISPSPGSSKVETSHDTIVKCPICETKVYIDKAKKRKTWDLVMDEFNKKAHGDCKLIGTIKQIEDRIKAGELEVIEE